ncbi:MAG: hypothetical protein ICV70_02730 [Jiangellaceae bacterium]|nr:hypothetical protein [Jiangellaceae bacterium]
MRARSTAVAATVTAAVSLLAAVAGVAPASGAPTPSGTPSAVASLTSLTPGVLQRGGQLVLAGSVQNTGKETLLDVQAILRYSAIPITDRADVRRIRTDTSLRWGRRYVEYFAELGDLAPGESSDYQLTVPVDEISVGDPGGYVVGVDIRASTAGGPRATLDTARTVVPWLADEQPLPTVPVALLWPLTASPSLLSDGRVFDDRLGAAVQRGGPLDLAVRAPQDAPVSWVVDPDLPTTVDAMSDGYAVAAPGGATTEGTAAADAAAWIAAFRAATMGDAPMVLPYANPDLQAIGRVDPDVADAMARRAVTASRDWVTRQSPAAAPSDVAWPAGGAADETLAAYAAAGVGTVVLAGDAITPPIGSPLAQVSAAGTSLDAVLTDPGLGAAIMTGMHEQQAGELVLRQSWLTETALAALGAAATGTAPAPLVVAPPIDWQPAAAFMRSLLDVWTTTPWVTPTRLRDLPVTERPLVRLAPTTTTTPPQPPAGHTAATLELADRSAQYAVLLADSKPVADPLDLTVLRAGSANWRADPDAAADYVELARAEVDARLNRVSLIIPESVTLSGQTGSFPLTIRNGLPDAVRVQLRVHADNPDRLAIGTISAQQVDAGENATVDVVAEAAANGKVPVTVQLATTDGRAVGSAHRLLINATEYGTWGWIIVGTGLVLFALGTILRFFRLRRESRAAPATTPRTHPVTAPAPEHPATTPPAERPAATPATTQRQRETAR